VVDPDPSNPSRGVVRVVPVQTGFDDGKRIQVTSGLMQNDRVIVRGNTPLSAGDHAVAVEWRGR
jgi:multidrug efflux pump subunit AcrA (membrane-fusion protein)